jgi:hypothetical protein
MTAGQKERRPNPNFEDTIEAKAANKTITIP